MRETNAYAPAGELVASSWHEHSEARQTKILGHPADKCPACQLQIEDIALYGNVSLHSSADDRAEICIQHLRNQGESRGVREESEVMTR